MNFLEFKLYLYDFFDDYPSIFEVNRSFFVKYLDNWFFLFNLIFPIKNAIFIMIITTSIVTMATTNLIVLESILL